MTPEQQWDEIDTVVREYSSMSGEQRARDLFMRAIAAAEARGYARAREQMAKRMDAIHGSIGAKRAALIIRAMKDEGGE